MWISKKKWDALEKRVADLEKKQDRQNLVNVSTVTSRLNQKIQERLTECHM